MNGDDRSKLVDRVHKLLSLSSGTSNENEAGVAAAKAAELIEAYNLSQHELEKAGAKKAEPIGYRVVHPKTHAGKPLFTRKDWVVTLANCVADVNFCEARFGPWGIVFYGRPGELELLEYMFQNLVSQLERLAWQRGEEYARAFYREHHIYPRKVSGADNIHIWKACWLEGAVMVVCGKLLEQKRKFESASKTGMELVVSRGEELAEYFRQRYAAREAASGKKNRKKKETFNSSAPSAWNGEAFNRGMADGTGIDVQPGIGTNNAKRVKGG